MRYLSVSLQDFVAKQQGYRGRFLDEFSLPVRILGRTHVNEIPLVFRSSTC